jgi:hypothetical protein
MLSCGQSQCHSFLNSWETETFVAAAELFYVSYQGKESSAKKFGKLNSSQRYETAQNY